MTGRTASAPAAPEPAPRAPAPTAPLFGLVLAGGESTRMGRDKGAIVFRGEPQVRRSWRLLNRLCVGAYVSARPAQAEAEPYLGLPMILDETQGLGPAAGLTSAWGRQPGAAWLVLATDMPLVDADLLVQLIRARDPASLATCFRQPDGLLQPLCAIWEPRARITLDARLAQGDASLRRALETGPIRELAAPERPERLASMDTEEDYGRIVSAGV
ncbi:MAG TPA: NTP transferase domain-containing protein [Gammaproteobacteria bacterium]|nr:NTP transferase domain-containing protein [Gammaproteobacteria bacterium]